MGDVRCGVRVGDVRCGGEVGDVGCGGEVGDVICGEVGGVGYGKLNNKYYLPSHLSLPTPSKN